MFFQRPALPGEQVPLGWYSLLSTASMGLCPATLLSNPTRSPSCTFGCIASLVEALKAALFSRMRRSIQRTIDWIGGALCWVNEQLLAEATHTECRGIVESKVILSQPKTHALLRLHIELTEDRRFLHRWYPHLGTTRRLLAF